MRTSFWSFIYARLEQIRAAVKMKSPPQAESLLSWRTGSRRSGESNRAVDEQYFEQANFRLAPQTESDRAGRRHIACVDAGGHTWLARKSSPSLFLRFERDLWPTLRRRALANQNA